MSKNGVDLIIAALGLVPKDAQKVSFLLNTLVGGELKGYEDQVVKKTISEAFNGDIVALVRTIRQLCDNYDYSIPEYQQLFTQLAGEFKDYMSIDRLLDWEQSKSCFVEIKYLHYKILSNNNGKAIAQELVQRFGLVCDESYLLDQKSKFAQILSSNIEGDFLTNLGIGYGTRKKGEK